MTTVLNVLNHAQLLAQTDTNGIDSTNTTGNGLAFMNDAVQDFTRELIHRDIDAAQTQESYTDLNTATPNTYAYPSDMFALKTIEVNFTDSTQSNYIQAQQIDVSNLQNGTAFDWVRANQPITAPLFDDRGDTFEIFPTPPNAITKGIRIFYFLTPTDFTGFSGAGAAGTLAYPFTLDYRCLSAKVAALYAASIGSLDLVKTMEDQYQKRLQQIIKILAQGSQQPIDADPLHITGWQY